MKPREAVYFEVYGCAANMADAEMMAGLLEREGYRIVEAPDEADVLVVVTCVVKGPTEARMVHRISKLNTLGKPLVVAGCMPKAEGWLVRRIAPGACTVGPNSVRRVVEAVRSALSGRVVDVVEDDEEPKTGLPRKRLNPVVHIEEISSGCLGSCAYCIVRLARGRLRSYPPEEIVRDVERAVSEGCRFVWVTSQDTAAYRYEDVRLPQLLGMICEVEGDFHVRVGMMNPVNALEILDDLLDAYEDPKVFKFLHLPVQSGSDRVLKLMNRRYTVDEFKQIVSKFRSRFPRMTLVTDVICGFPGEGEEDFSETVRLLEEIRPDFTHVSKFTPRPGTPAARMKQLPTQVVKERSRRVSALTRTISLERNMEWVGWRGWGVVEKPGKGGGYVARNFAYRPIVLDVDAELGERLDVVVVGAEATHLRGEPALYSPQNL